MQEIWDEAARRLGGVDALDLSRELVSQLVCGSCGQRQPIFQPVEKITEAQALCGRCGAESAPDFFHSIAPGSELLNKTVAEIGLPTWDVMWARSANRAVGFELAGDNPFSTRPEWEKEISHVLS